MNTSSSPAATMSPRTLPAGTCSLRMEGGNAWSTSFTLAASPPSNQSMSCGFTPYSSWSMPRIQTAAVMWNLGTPARFPFRSSGFWMPEPLWT